MLRVGLTGGLGSGKSTVAALFASLGTHVIHADEIGRELMQPGRPVYCEILDRFRNYADAPPLTLPNGELDRAALAQYAFSTGHIDDLNRIVHPPVIAEQDRRMGEIFHRDPNAIAMVESALIFEVERGGTGPGLRQRFDRLILVTAPEDVRVARTVERMTQNKALSSAELLALEQDIRRRMAAQISDTEKIPICDFIIDNAEDSAQTEATVQIVWTKLQTASKAKRGIVSA